MTTYTAAKVFTGAGPKEFCSAFTIEDGMFTWVGEAEGVDAATVDGEVVTLGEATVLPGLLDVHTHPSFMATLADSMALLQPLVVTRAGLVKQLRCHPGLGAGPDVWVMGFGYNEDNYPDGAPTRHTLDEVSTTQPVFARRADGHTAVCNTFALQLAGISAQTPDPPYGQIVRDQAGDPTGLLVEPDAVDLVYQLRPAPDRDEVVRRLVGLNEHFLSLGLVSINDLYGNFIVDPLATYRDAERSGYLPSTGVFLAYPAGELPRLTDQDRMGRMRIAGVKVFMDGAFSNRTAWVDEPYPGTESHGIVTASDEELRTAVAWARGNQVQCAVHVMGDRGINHLMDLFEDEAPWMGELPSIRFDHSTLFTAEMMQRANRARMNFGIVTHTVFFFAEYDSYVKNLGPRQFDIAYPIRTLYDNVDHLALSSDAPATAWSTCDDPFLSVKAAVTRTAYTGDQINAKEAVTVGEALHLYTGKAAQVSVFRDVGVITAGYEGSFIVVDRDPFTIDPSELDEVKVMQTWIRGERVY
ncbi:MAG: amidohydrolase family protein [Humibacillus sp.]|nr:amidohydrolase family protein [Humibacillus sp.]MDN5778153.1 amidohydrolase family protein [Humibacillus sp.]